MTKPYYSHAGITIWNGDCREILPTLKDSSVDCVSQADRIIALKLIESEGR